jgi:hypothetical protein
LDIPGAGCCLQFEKKIQNVLSKWWQLEAASTGRI